MRGCKIGGRAANRAVQCGVAAERARAAAAGVCAAGDHPGGPAGRPLGQPLRHRPAGGAHLRGAHSCSLIKSMVEISALIYAMSMANGGTSWKGFGCQDNQQGTAAAKLKKKHACSVALALQMVLFRCSSMSSPASPTCKCDLHMQRWVAEFTSVLHGVSRQTKQKIRLVSPEFKSITLCTGAAGAVPAQDGAQSHS